MAAIGVITGILLVAAFFAGAFLFAPRIHAAPAAGVRGVRSDLSAGFAHETHVYVSEPPIQISPVRSETAAASSHPKPRHELTEPHHRPHQPHRDEASVESRGSQAKELAEQGRPPDEEWVNGERVHSHSDDEDHGGRGDDNGGGQ